MLKKPLNLHALRAFEAAARHESFKNAAAELGVTPVAVTRHIKWLEIELGVILFERLHRGVRLNETGRELQEEMEPAFAAIRRGFERARRHSGEDTLNIGSETAFAKRWLVPRLGAFHDLHPDIHVDLRSQGDKDELDGIIFYGYRQRFGRDRHLLFHETVFPVCSPALLEGPLPLARPSDLARHHLLHDGSDDWWQRWFEAAGVAGMTAGSRELFFSHDHLYQAAIEGRGVLMGDDVLYGEDLAQGRLVRLFPETIEGNQFILAVRSSPPRKALEEFVAWILAACAAHKLRAGRLLATWQPADASPLRTIPVP